MSREIRQLSPMEYGLWFMDLAASVNFIHVAEIKGEISEQSLVKAVECVQKIHPLLQACVHVGKSRKAYFVHTEEKVETLCEDYKPGEKSLTQILEDENHRRFDTQTGPLFRVRALRGRGRTFVLLTIHHSIGDGVCGASLLKDLLAATDAIECGDAPNLAKPEQSGAMEDRLEKRFKGMSAIPKALSSLSGSFVKRNIFRKYAFIPLDGKAPPSRRRQRFILKELAPEITASLGEKAGANGSSVHAALAAAQLIAIRKEISGPEEANIPQLTLVDLRKRFSRPLDSRTMSVNISSVESVHKVSQDASLWSLAKEIKSSINDGLSRNEHFSYWPSLMRLMHLNRWSSPLNASGADSALRQGELARPSASIISNIGDIGFDWKFKSFSCERCHFAMAVSGSGLFSCSANAYNKRLHLNFTYAHPVISIERAKRIAEHACMLLSE